MHVTLMKKYPCALTAITQLAQGMDNSDKLQSE